MSEDSITVIGIAGGSGSGKTTFAKTLQTYWTDSTATILSQDHYYIDQSKKFTGDGESVNFDHPDAIDFNLFAEQISYLKQGKSVEVPIYDYSTHTRSAQTQRFVPKKYVIVEGILVMSQLIIREQMDFAVFIDLEEELRLKRRLERDTKERGRKPDGVYKQFANQVKPMHDQFVEPSKQYADLTLRGDVKLEEALKKFLIHFSN